MSPPKSTSAFENEEDMIEESGELPCFGPYQARARIGSGATAIVYHAEHIEKGTMHALKVIRLNQTNKRLDRRLRKLFMTEAAIATRIRHPNIVEIQDAQVDDSVAYIAMEYIEGEPLRHYCNFDSLLPPHRVVEIIFKCAMALDFAARRGIVHRDIKPDNIMLSSNDEVKIMDFGLALNLRKQSDADSTFIMGVGSPAYMSPEQIKDYPLNGQTDIYSLGTVLFEMLTGRQAFRAKNRAALMYKIINMDTEPVSSLNPSVPDTLDPIVQKALEKDLYSRYRNGMELAKDLSSSKFQLLDDADSVKLTKRFKMVRQCVAFTEFENDQIWELLRISYWREFNEGREFMTEGEEGNSFGVILQGEVEISLQQRRLAVVGPGEVLGELAFLLPEERKRATTVVARTDLIFLEVNASAYALATEETREHFQKLMAETVMKRTRLSNEKLLESAPPAMKGKRDDLEFSFDLVPMGDEMEDTMTSIILTQSGEVRVTEEPTSDVSLQVSEIFDAKSGRPRH